MATDLSGVPNSAELQELASKFFTADPGAISSIGGVWSTAAANSDTELGALTSTVDKIQSSWTGTGAASFTGWMQTFGNYSKQISTSLTTASAALGKAATALQQAQGNVNKIIQQVASDAAQLKSEISQLQAAKQDVSALEAQLQSLAANASPQVKQEIAQAEQQLSEVATDLQDAIDLAEGSFSAIKVPSGGPVNPPPSGVTPVTLTTDATPVGTTTPASGSVSGAAPATGSPGGGVSSSGAVPIWLGDGGGAAVGDTGAATASAAANQALAQQLAAKYGWSSGTQWQDLLSLWNKESGWSNTAMNPSSGAFGIAQALPPSKYPLAGQPTSMGGSASSAAQIQWGLEYIQQTYGSPAAAWAHEVAYNWY